MDPRANNNIRNAKVYIWRHGLYMWKYFPGRAEIIGLDDGNVRRHEEILDDTPCSLIVYGALRAAPTAVQSRPRVRTALEMGPFIDPDRG